MKKLTTFLFLFSLIISVSKAQEVPEKEFKSKIAEVTVYLNGAEVKRTASGSIPAGKSIVVIDELSNKLDPSSIQVIPSNGVEMLSISSEINTLNPEKLEPRIKTLKDSVELVSKKLQLVRDELDAYTTEKQTLLKNQSIGGANNGVSVLELEKAANFYRSRIFEVNKEVAKLSEKQSDLQKEVNKLNQQLNALNYKNNPYRRTIRILVETKTASTASFDVRYLVNSAGWEPTYDIVAEEIGKPIILKYKAKVFNDSDIDWKDIPLTLSSADPYESASRPELDPWYLNYGANYLQKKKAGYLQNANAPAAAGNYGNINDLSYQSSGAIQQEQQKYQKAPVNYKTITVSELSVDFKISKKYSIPSDAKPYIVDVSETNMPAEYSHIVVPKIDKDAFLLARVTGWEKLNLIEGNANIYFGNTFTGVSKINTLNFDDTLDISLGRDKKVLVSRTEKQDFQSKSILGSQRKDSYTYEIKIKNMHDKAIKLEIQDQYPVSQNSEITVDVQNISNADEIKTTGQLIWKADMPAGTTNTYELSYSIKYPKNKAKQVSTKNRYEYRSVRML